MAIRFSLGGYPVLDPLEVAREVQNHGKPQPADLSKINSIFNPVGREPSRGWFAMFRRDIVLAGVNAYQTLIASDGTRSATVPNLVISKEPINLIPSIYATDDKAPFLVEVSDKRWLAKNPYFQVAVNKQYNVRAPAYGGAGSGAALYCADTLNAGSAWTWQTLVSDLWGLLPMLGAAPTLPYTPDGTPDGWVFPGVSAWDALCDVLDRISCNVKWDWQTGLYSIVNSGSADIASDTILTEAERRKIHDAGYLSIVLGREPAFVRVFFHRREQFAGTEETNTRATSAAWQPLHAYSVDVAGNNGAATGTYHVLWDDLPAIYDATGTLTNSAALATRAAERAAQYYQSIRTIGGTRLHKTYSGLVLLSPGSTVKGVAWRQRQVSPDGEGDLVTEVVRHPFAAVKISDQGQWEECCNANTPDRMPFFGPQWPVYPLLEQVLEITTAAPSGGLYDATLQKPASSTAFTDKDSIWGLDFGGSTSLAVGSKFNCRLFYYDAAGGGRPVYSFRSTAGTVPGSVVIKPETSATSTVTNVLTVAIDSTGAPDSGFGQSTIWTMDSATVEDRTVKTDTLTWIVAADATRTVQESSTYTDFGGTYTATTATTTGSTASFSYGLVPGGGNVTVGGGTAASELQFKEPSGGGSSYVSFQAPALAGNTPYTLPNAYPAVTGYVLSATTAGVMSWVAASGATPFSGAHVEYSGGAGPSDGTPYVIDWDSEDYDEGAYWDAGGDTTIFTIPANGYYRIGCSVSGSSMAVVGTITVEFRVNGAAERPKANDHPLGDEINLILTTDLLLAIGDEVDVRVHSYNTAMGMTVDAADFWIEMIG